MSLRLPTVRSSPWRLVTMLILVALATATGVGPAHAASAAHGFHLQHLLILVPGLTQGDPVNYPTVSDLQLGYKRSTTKLYQTYTRRVQEYRMFDDIPDEEIIPSGRLNNILLDVAVGVGAANIVDAGYESRTETPELVEGEFVFNHTNSRFAISLRAQAFDKAARGNQIIRQIKYQSLKCIEAVMRKYGFMTYGTSSAVVSLVLSAPGATLTPQIYMNSAFGVAGLNDPAYLSGMWPIDEGIGFIRSNVLIATGVVTATDPIGGSVTLLLNESVAILAGDQMVYANAVIGATLNETDWQNWNVGILDALITDTVHGVSASQVPTWAPALFDSLGGSMGFIKVRRMRQALENKGDTTLRKLIVSNGVENDMDARERQALVWMNNSTGMNVDGATSIKGVDKMTTRFVPPTCAFGIGADAMGKKVLTEKPDENETIEFGKLFKAEDRSALKGGVDLISAMIFRSRSRLTGFTGLDEQ